jgi:hypothetical protein
LRKPWLQGKVLTSRRRCTLLRFHLPDICFLADTTGSMGGAIANVQANISSIIASVRASAPNAQFCAAQYRDFGEAFVFNLDEPVTGVTADVVAAVNAWVGSGGGDIPEAQLTALHELATDAGVGFRAGSTRVIVWFGDAPGHDPSGPNTQASVISDLTTGANSPIIVIAISTGIDQLDSTGQATAIANATGGQVFHSPNPNAVAAAILTGLSNLPAEVAMVSDYAAPISATFAPASQVVPSGTDAVFIETISVDPAAAPGTYECDDWATING